MRWAWILIILVVGCGDDDAVAPDGAQAGDGRPGDAPPDGLGGAASAGRLTVTEVNATFGGSGSFFGEFMAGGLPVWHRETMVMGDCRLFEYDPPFCDPFCDFQFYCAEGNVCQPYPTFMSAGTITVSGLKTALVAQPSACGFCVGEQYQPPALLPADLFDDGDPVSAVAAGAAFPAFTVEAAGVTPLEATFTAGKIVIQDDVDETVSWTAAGGDARVRLTINANNFGHGAPYEAIIICDTADTGQVVVPGAMITAFPPAVAADACGGSDCPPSRLMRYRRGVVETSAGKVELIVGSEILFGVDH